MKWYKLCVFAAAVPQVWNSLPTELRQCDFIKRFKRHLNLIFRLWDHGALLLLGSAV